MRHLNDVLFDRLVETPDFLERSRSLVEADWRTGTDSFREYVTPLLDGLFAEGGFGGWGDLSYDYLARRVMEDTVDPTTPWLWAYSRLTGAHGDPAKVRKVLNALASHEE